MFQQTPLKRETLRSTLTQLVLGFLTMATVLYGGFSLHPQKAFAATDSTVNFQARLEGPGGAIAADGYYNIEFKLYNASGTNLWTEDYYDANGTTAGLDNRAKVVNGYITVSLGSQTAFPTTINWDQTLTLGMNVGGTTQTATPTYDGEMTPRLGLTAVPYAFRAGQLAQGNAAGTYTSTLGIVQPTAGNQTFQIQDQAAAGSYTICVQGATTAAGGCAASTGAAGYIQNQNTAAQSTSNFWISGTGTAGTSLLTPLLDTPVGTTNLAIGTNNASTITLNQNTRVIGSLGVGTTSTYGKLTVVPTAITTIGAVIQGASGQTADLLDLRDSGTAVLSGFAANGNLTLGTLGILGGSSSAVAGTLILGDGSDTTSVAAKSGSLQLAGTLASNQSYLLPTTGGTICLTTGNCSAAGGYIVNSSSLQASSNFNISGTGTAATKLLTPNLDTATATTLTIGGTATALTVSPATTINNSLAVTQTGNANLFSITGSTVLFTADTTTSRITIGAVGGCVTNAGKLCVNTQNAASGNVTNSSNVVGLTTTAGSTNYNQRILINDTSTAKANVNYDLYIDNTGTTNSGASSNGIYINSPAGLGGGNLIQLDSAGNDVLTASNAGVVTLGEASALTGQLAFANASNGFTATLQGNTAATASYTSVLMGAVGLAGQCLAVSSVASTTQTLGYASCGGGGSLQTSYTASTGSSTPEIKLDSTRNGLDIQDADTTIGASQPLLAVRASNGAGLGAGLFTIGNTGATLFENSTNSTAAFQIQNSAGTPIFLVDTATNQSGNLLTNGGFENGTVGSTPTGWSTVVPSGTVTATKNTTAPFHYGGLASANVTTSGASGQGISTNTFSSVPASSTTYTVSFYAESVSGITASANFGVSYNGGAATACTAGVTLVTSGFQRISCTVATPAGTVTSMAITQNAATASQYYIDAVQLVLGSSATPASAAGGIQLRGAVEAPVVFQALSNSSTAFQIQNAAGTSNIFVADTLNNQLTLGGSNTASILNVGTIGTAAVASTVHIGDTSGNAAQIVSIGSITSASSTTTIQGGTGSSALTIQTGSGGTTNIDTNAVAHTINVGTGAAVQTIAIGSTNGTSKLTLNGSANANSATNGVTIGSSTSDTTQVNLQLDSSSTLAETASTCSTTVNQGALYYNTATAVAGTTVGSNAIRACVNGNWEDVVTTSGLGIITFGVIPDSTTATGQGDLPSATNFNSGPCKTYISGTANIISWTACAAYSGGRKVLIAAGTATVSASTSVYQSLCLNGTNNIPTLSAAQVSDSTVGLFPTFSINNPILCLAMIKTGTTASTVAAITDTRAYTTDIKQFATVSTASGLGAVLQNNASQGRYIPITATTSLAIGVMVAYSGTTSTTTPNAIIVTNGPVAVKATAGSVGGVIQSNGSGSGYAITAAGSPGSGSYNSFGIAQTSYSASATNCAVNTGCADGLFTLLSIR